MTGAGRKAAGPRQTVLKHSVEELAPPAHGSPTQVTSPRLHYRPPLHPLQDRGPPTPVAGEMACHGQPSFSIEVPSPALHPLDGSQHCQEFPSACPLNLWPFLFLLRKSLSQSPNPARNLSPKPAPGDFRSWPGTLGQSGEGQPRVALPKIPALVQTHTGPFSSTWRQSLAQLQKP